MKRQRNMTQMKEQIKTPEKEPNKMETKNLNAKLKTLVTGCSINLMRTQQHEKEPVINEGTLLK